MGAWGAGSFSNDTALDFIEGLDDFEIVLQTLSRFSKRKKEPLDIDDASIALAACDLLTLSLGRPPLDLPEPPEFQNQSVTVEQLKLAKSVVKLVRTSSELAEVWAEEEDGEWQQSLDDLILRLSPSKPYKAPKAKTHEPLPDDFLGYCYLCYGLVTKRDGILFEHTSELGGTCTIHPHINCIEEIILQPALNNDGSPTDAAHKVLMQHMGFDV